MKTTPKTMKKKQTGLTTNEELFSFYKIYPDNYKLVTATDFHVKFYEQPLENVVSFDGFLFIVEPKLRSITELRSGAKIYVKQVENNPKEPFSSYVAKIFKWVKEHKDWYDINNQVSCISFAYREPHLNLLIL